MRLFCAPKHAVAIKERERGREGVIISLTFYLHSRLGERARLENLHVAAPGRLTMTAICHIGQVSSYFAKYRISQYFNVSCD